MSRPVRIDRQRTDRRTAEQRREARREEVRRVTVRETCGRAWEHDNGPDVRKGRPATADTEWRARRSA